jgi:REP element-mobilizing transposase RayT
MSRQKREDYPGARHHVMNRGARRDPVFPDDRACARFIHYLAELPVRFGLLVHAYALMPNHYHLLLESESANLSAGMAFLGGAYSQWLNAIHRAWDGPLFRGRFKSKLVIHDEHWYYLPIYLHLNPVRAGIVPTVEQSHWTSHGVYAGTEQTPEWLTTGDLLAGYGDHEGYRRYLQEVVEGRSAPPDGFEQVSFARYSRTPRSSRKLRTASIDRSLSTAEPMLDAVSDVCNVHVSDILKTRRGRRGNQYRKIAVYCLVYYAGWRSSEVAATLGIHRTQVSQMLRSVRERRAAEPDFDELLWTINNKC